MSARAVADLLARALAAAVAAGDLPPVAAPPQVVEPPRDPAHGDYASNLALLLARPLGRPPLAVAEAIARHVPPGDLAAEVRAAAPGFLNVRLDPAWLRAELAARLATGPTNREADLGGGAEAAVAGPTFAEALAADATAGRRAVVAEALAAIFERTGHRVVRGGANAPAVKAVAVAPPTPTFGDVVAAIGADAARFLLLARPADEAIALDLGLARRQTAENPAFYARYTHARVAGALRVAAAEHPTLVDPAGAPLDRLDAPEELALLRRLAAWPDALAGAVRGREPSRIARHVLALADGFHRWHAAHRILGDDPTLVHARIALATAVRDQLAAALADVLGVAAPEQVDELGGP